MRREIRRKINSSGSGICDICKQRSFLVEHHIEGRDIPNPNHKSNLCRICDNDHRRTHNGSIIIEKWALTDEGLKLLWHYKDEESLTGINAKPYVY